MLIGHVDGYNKDVTLPVLDESYAAHDLEERVRSSYPCGLVQTNIL